MHFCHLGGHVVGAEYPIGKSPSDYYAVRLPMVGCSRIRCQTCRMLARNIPGKWFKSDRDEVDLAALYEQADLESSPLLMSWPGARMYLCRCSRWLEHSSRPLADPDPDMTSTNVPWRCEGHLGLELPADVDGAHIANEKELIDAVVRSLSGWTPPDAYPEDKKHGYWAARMFMRLEGSPYAEPIARAVAERFEDPDPTVRASAIQFFYHTDLKLGVQRAAQLLVGDRKLFNGVPDPLTTRSGDKTLSDSLWRVAAPQVGAIGPLRDLARAEALNGAKASEAVYAALSQHDPDWMAEHAEEVFQAKLELGQKLITIITANFPLRVPRKPVLDKLRALVKK